MMRLCRIALLLAVALAVPAHATPVIRGSGGGGGAAPVVASFSATDTGATAVTQIEVTKPSGTAEGDYLVAFVSKDSTTGTGWTLPSAWNQVSNSTGGPAQHKLHADKTAGGSEPATYIFEHDDSDNMRAAMLRITGAAASGQLETFLTNDTSGANPLCPSITTSGANRLILLVVFQDQNGSLTQPAGSTLVTSSGGSTISISVAAKVQASAGSTGTAEWTGNTNSARCFSIAIKP